MPRIAWVEDEDASGELGDLYSLWKRNNPGRDRFPAILKTMSARPELLKGMMDASYSVHFADGHLQYRTKELIATFVSALNACRY